MKRKKRKAAIHHRLLARVNALFAFLLLVSYLAPYIPPDPIWPIGLMGLAYPILFLVNVAFLLFWIILKKKYLIMPLITILAGWNHIGNHFRIVPSATSETVESVDILSYNIQLSKNRRSPQNPKNAAQWITSITPDIICFQEIYYSANEKNIRFFSGLPQDLVPDIYNRGAGLAILSRFPNLNNGIISSEGAVFCVYADVRRNKDTIRVYNTQLAGNYLDEEKALFNQESQLGDNEISQKASSMIQKLIVGYELRVKQVKLLSDHIKTSPYPVILCGDFNNTPLSYTYYKLKGENLRDSFKKQRWPGMGNTYNGNMPPIRIDYILHDNHYQTISYQCHKEQYSDHFAISAEIALP